VSPFRRSTIFVSVERDRVVLVKAGARPGMPAEAERLDGIDLACGDLTPIAEPLRAILSAPGWRGLQRRILISDRLVHHAAVERPLGVRTFGELQLAVEGRMEQLFDIDPPDWAVRVDAKPFAKHVAACALPRRLGEAIQAALCAGATRVSIRPYLLCELDRHAKRLPNACWFATAGRDYVAIVRVHDGCCRRIRIHPTPRPDARLAVALVERSRTLLGEEQGAEATFLSGLPGDHEGGDVVHLDERETGKGSSARVSIYGRAMAEVWA
jgi:hypothetical protein